MDDGAEDQLVLLGELLTIARDHLSVDPAYAGAEQQQARASCTARGIEAFLRRAGLPIVEPD